jgi:hypothetical protein
MPMKQLNKMVSMTQKIATVAMLCGFATAASALTVTVTNDTFSSVAGASTIDFGVSSINNTGPVAGSAAPGSLLLSGTLGGVNYSYTDGALFNFDGSSGLPGGTSARPVGSTGNFWSVGTSPDEQDGPGIVDLGAGVSYYGFLWGSPDASGWNSVTFYNGNTVLGAFDGSAILNPPNGNQTFARYFNVFADPGEVITGVSFAANTNAFETDNHAFISAVPEPEIYSMMGLGLGLMGWVARRKKALAA